MTKKKKSSIITKLVSTGSKYSYTKKRSLSKFTNKKLKLLKFDPWINKKVIFNEVKR